MTTNIDSEKNNSSDFSIRTMQDDLLKAQSASISPEPALGNSQPINFQAESPTKKNTDYPKAVSETVSPFETEPEVIKEQPKQKEKEIILEEQLLKEDFSQENKSPVFKIIISLIILLTISIIGFGGYYFWSNKTAQPTNEVVPVAETPIETPVENIIPPSEKYSQDKPNYLVLDLSTLATEDIKKIFSSIIEELKVSTTQNPGALYEFVAVDANNNPIAFPIFTAATKINLSSNVLAGLENDFSLFFYNDNGEIRLAFATSIINKDLVAKEMLAQEKTLPTDIAFMFLDATVENTSGIFKDGSQLANNTRYLNLNTQGTLSIDYTLTNTDLILGTSKDTLKSVLDKKIVSMPTQIPEPIVDSTVQENVQTTEGVTIPTAEEQNLIN